MSALARDAQRYCSCSYHLWRYISAVISGEKRERVKDNEMPGSNYSAFSRQLLVS